MSCVSLLEYRFEREDDAGLFEVEWPTIVQGIRVYAVAQPPEVASDLLKLAEFVAGIAELHDGS